jgi:hypothetical protein
MKTRKEREQFEDFARLATFILNGSGSGRRAASQQG